MLWSGLIRINKIVKLNTNYVLYIDPLKSNETLKNLSSFYKEINNEYILNVKINSTMLCNSYDQFKIKTTKKFTDIDFSNSNVFIKLEITDLLISVKTMTKTQIKLQQHEQKKRDYKVSNMSIRKRFTSDLINICKKT
jgi:hypothetical protein